MSLKSLSCCRLQNSAYESLQVFSIGEDEFEKIRSIPKTIKYIKK
jgi:hypothetical protein